MIGQKNLLEKIDKLADNGKFPRFVILIGAKGSGRHLVSSHIAKKLSASLYDAEIGVDAIRLMIPAAYRTTDPCVYLLANVETMSPSAKNALLKVTEEPPQNAYFILTATDTSFILPTLLSRGTVFNMDLYSVEEMFAFAAENDMSGSKIVDLCETPGEALLLQTYNFDEFTDYTKLVINNIDKASFANLYKIGTKIKIKETDSGYDLKLFWKSFTNMCFDNWTATKEDKYIVWACITSKFLRDLKITGINIQNTFDMWLTEIQGWEEEWI